MDGSAKLVQNCIQAQKYFLLPWSWPFDSSNRFFAPLEIRGRLGISEGGSLGLHRVMLFLFEYPS